MEELVLDHIQGVPDGNQGLLVDAQEVLEGHTEGQGLPQDLIDAPEAPVDHTDVQDHLEDEHLPDVIDGPEVPVDHTDAQKVL